MTGRVARSGATSSSQANATSPATAGQYPTRAGSGSSPTSGGVRSAFASSRCTVRSGLTHRHTGPSRTEASGTATQSRTYATPAVGLFAVSGPASAAAPTQPAASRPTTRPATRGHRAT